MFASFILISYRCHHRLRPTLFLHLAASKKHTTTVLSLSPNPTLASTLSITVMPASYDDHNSFVSALTGVHTLISTIGSFYPAEMASSQLVLLTAAKEARVARFAPNEFAHLVYDGIDTYAGKKRVWAAAKASGLEVTKFATGLFMNGLAMRSRGSGSCWAGLRPWHFCVNARVGKADWPGTGGERAAWSEIGDVCRFVVAALDLERWEEKVQRRRFLVKVTRRKELVWLPEVPGKRFYHQTRIVYTSDAGMVEPTLSEKLKEIRPVSIEEFMRKAWEGVELGEPTWDEDRTFG
ncbi:NAD-P-binding protein [Patellaria atrata CBS 101060]|uniref:NAD-P-binding protein n=1 Tax=Patellaria atrata CBS 101060 TaxID=1346257 RepID=A0A9P4SJJ1_9PEZI|nr:NAD-P-binding protein [Patellaria atrata CBS 101060]